MHKIIYSIKENKKDSTDIHLQNLYEFASILRNYLKHDLYLTQVTVFPFF